MAWRQVRYLLDAEVQSSDDSTKIVKLPLSNVIHTIYIKAKITTGATSAKSLTLDDAIDKIEVIGNGSEVIFSLTPQELRRWAWFDLGKAIPEVVNQGPSQVMEAMYPIFFGFDEWDPNYYLPCSKFTDLELRVKYSPTIAATAFATGTFTLTVIALMTMGGDPGPYQGTLRKTTIYDWTTAASGDEVVDLPRRLLYSRAMIYCYEAGVEDGVDITKIKFSLNNDQLIPLNLKWADLVDWLKTLYALDTEWTAKLYAKDGDTINVIGNGIQKVTLTPLVAEHVAGVSGISGNQITVELNNCAEQAVDEGGSSTYTICAAQTSEKYLHAEIESKFVPHAVLIPFAELNGDQFFDPTKYDMVQFVLTQGGAGGDAKISLEEILKFA